VSRRACGGRDRAPVGHDGGVSVFEPTADEVLEFCARAPVERVFLEDLARSALGRFAATRDTDGLTALCHVGANVAPSGCGCGAFARVAQTTSARMIIGEEGAVTELWSQAHAGFPRPRADRPGQPVFVIDTPPPSGGTALRRARASDFERLVPACAAAHAEELGVDPLAQDADGFRHRVRRQIESGRSWLWVESGAILFKAEASAWTRHAVQLGQVWVDPEARNSGYGSRGLRDLLRLLLEHVPAVCLFVRLENVAAIRLYESVGMRRSGTYRSILL
jgi:ribosomal protein S18 acetylase RimI-like enzyme